MQVGVVKLPLCPSSSVACALSVGLASARTRAASPGGSLDEKARDLLLRDLARGLHGSREVPSVSAFQAIALDLAAYQSRDDH